MERSFIAYDHDTVARLLGDVVEKDDPRLIRDLAAACAKGSKTDVAAAEKRLVAHAHVAAESKIAELL